MTGPSARYDEVAGEYRALFGDGVEDPATRAVLDLVGDVTGLELLDLPCGEGRVARELARRGARVVGVDISSAMLERAPALERTEPLDIRYVQADGASPDACAGETFDGVVCNYGLSDIDDLDGLLATIARAVRPGGSFVLSMLHPCFPGVGTAVSASWRPGGGYYEEGWWRSDAPGSGLRRTVGANHRMLSTYVNALARRGLVLEAMAEPAQPEGPPGIESVPIFLAARCRKG